MIRSINFFYLNIVSLFYISFLFISVAVSQINYSKTDFRSPLGIPLILSGNFAELRSNHFHTGLDIKTNGKSGYRIYSIDSGFVSRINISHWGYGKTIYVDHPNGYTSIYAHLSRFPQKIEEYIRKEQFKKETETLTLYLDKDEIIVSKGEIIAFSGNTGGSSGPHLHFEIRETEATVLLSIVIRSESVLNPIPKPIVQTEIIKEVIEYKSSFPFGPKI